MTRSDRGNYKRKHPDGTQVDARVAAAVADGAGDDGLGCKSAEQIAATLGVSLADVGVAADLGEVRIQRCQLGLFGYGKGKPGIIVEPAEQVSAELSAAIDARLENGKLPCLAAWEIAAEKGLGRIEVCAACEKLQIRITACQLGAF